VPADDADDFPLFHNRAINREAGCRLLVQLHYAGPCLPAAVGSMLGWACGQMQAATKQSCVFRDPGWAEVALFKSTPPSSGLKVA
jgi:hypothetical protein